MIFLYSKLDIQNKGEGLGSLQDFVEEPIVTWNASGYLEVEFKYFLYGDLAEYMIPDAKLKTRIHSNDEVYHLFTIYEVEPDYIENTIQVRAELTLLHELKDRVVPSGTMRGTANEMIMFVKNKMDRDYPFVITGTTDRSVFIEHDNISAYELIFGEDGILKRTGAEIEFTDRGIRVSNRIGTIHRDELRESDFVTNLTVNELQGEDFVTRIIPFTTAMFDRPVRDGDRYTRETIETPTYGTPVISPNIANKLYKVRTKFVEYRNEPTEVPKYYNYQTDRGTETLEMSEYIYEDVDALNHDASIFFEDNTGIDEPTTTITIETLGLAKGYYTYLRYLNRYDIVTIYVEPKPHLTNSSETYVVQVNETVYEPLSDNLVSIGFTNDSISLRDAYRNVNEGRISDQQLQAELQKERLRDLEDRLVNYVYNHDGFRLEFGNVLPPPDEYREGDLYYLETGEGIDIYQLVNGAWEFLVGQSTREIIEGKIEEIEKQAEELTKDIEASDQKATEAKEEAGLAKSASEAAEVIAQQAQAEAESANTNSSEALEKAILAGIDAETAKQNALDAVNQASTAKQNASDALGKAGEAVTKANDAIGKANQIPQDIQNEIESKGLVSGSWVESHVDDVTGEINYALSEVSGSIPTVIFGVTWDKSESPILTRTDYVEEYANLTDYLLKTNEIDFDIDGLDGRMSTVETNKLDSTEFTSFKTNDYDVTVEGFTTALTDKLDTKTFNTFKTNEFEMTVDGINGSIESLQTEKLDSTDFNTFKSNEYELTVDGLRMDLSSVSGSIPTVIMGVEWDKSQNPELTRTDYLEYDNPNLYSPSFIMGVRWDKSENPTLYRTDDTGGVDNYEYSQQTAQFTNDISGLSGRVTSVETNKLGANEFNSFKTNTYAVDLAGLRTNITSLDEGKLGSDEFSNFKTNVFDVSVSGLSGRIGTVETKKLDSETYNDFKTNTYDVDVSGLQSRMSSVESKKLDSGTFETFRDTTYTNTINGITGNISTLQQNKLDSQDFNSFKQNEYEVTVDGLKMGLTDVQGSFPTIVLGVEWDKSSDPELTRTDFAEVDNPNLYAPSFVMGVMWDKKASPTMYRVADTGGVGDYEFKALQAEYNFTKESWSTRLSQIENAGYATQSWSNQTFATPQSVSTQLQSYAKTTDLNGMVTETTLATKNYITAGAVSTLLTSYAKTGDVPTATQFNSLKNRYDSMEQIIGTDKDSVARAVMTSSLWETEVSKVIDEELEQEFKTVNAKVNVVDGGGSVDMHYGSGTGQGRTYYFNNIDGYVKGILYQNKPYTLEFSTQKFDNKGNAITLQVKPHDATAWTTLLATNLTAGTQVNTFTFTNTVFASSVSDYRLIIAEANSTNITYIWGFRLYEEVEVEVPITGSNTGAIGSKITQLYDMINLSVLGQEGALSRIAVGEEGIQIDGKLLHITAKTFIDDAVIKSAMVDTLDAGKITTGELNANNVSIVNLDVNKLTGNAFNFVKGAFTSSSSRVSITGDGLDIIRIDGSRVIELDSQGIGITGQSGKKMGRIGHLADGGYGEETVAVGGAYNTDLLLAYQETEGNTYTPAIKVAKNTGNITVSESATFNRTVYMNSLFYLGNMRMSGGTGSVGGVSTANLSFPSTGGQLRVANGDLYIRSSSGDYYSFKQLWNKVYS